MQNISIHSLNGTSNLSDNKIFGFDSILKGVKGIQLGCLLNQAEGGFFNISPDIWGYYFYYGGYFLTVKNNIATVHQTIDTVGFKRFKTKKIKIGNMAALACQPESEVFINYQATADNQYIYFLPAIAKAKGNVYNAFIDVYDNKTYNYKLSIEVPMASKIDLPNQLTVLDDYLYLNFNEGELRSYQLVKK